MITNLTSALKQHLVKAHGMAEDITYNDAKAFVTRLHSDGKITVDKIKELGGIQSPADVEKKFEAMVTKAVNAAIGQGGNIQMKSTGGIEKLMATNTDTDNLHIRVKDPSERYYDTKTIAKHRVTGRPVELEGSPIYLASQKELAKVGVWFKNFCRKNSNEIGKVGISQPAMSEHEENLLAEMRAKGRWSGMLAGEREVAGMTLGEMYGKSGSDDMTLKALLDDSTSGGAYIIPNEFDEAVITYPLLHSELLPRIDLRTTNRQTVDTAAFSNPTVAWGGSDVSVSVFTTTSMIAQIQTSVYDVVAAIEMGRDFLADSPVDVGAKLTEIYGQVFAKEYDDVICNGVDGSSQPEGILQASSTVAVNSENGSTGPWTVTDVEALLFGIAKPYRVAGMNGCFLSNDVTYSRLRGIEVGTTDQRRVFGMDHESYTTFGRPHLINGDAGNAYLAFVAMKKYAMWRRAGLQMEFVTGGKTLALANHAILIARARVGGQLLDPDACAVISDGQS